MRITAWSDTDHILNDQIMSERRRPLHVVSRWPAKEMMQIVYTVRRTAVHTVTVTLWHHCDHFRTSNKSRIIANELQMFEKPNVTSLERGLSSFPQVFFLWLLQKFGEKWHKCFTGWKPFLSPKQQCNGTKGNTLSIGSNQLSDLRLSSSTTGLLYTGSLTQNSNSTAWWQRTKGVNNLPMIAM